MASTRKEELAAKKYYRENAAYRRKKIKRTAAEHKMNREEHNKNAREYYHTNTSYRKWKIAYAKKYQSQRRGK